MDSLSSANEESYLEQILGLLPIAAYTCDLDGLITFFNEEAVNVWGRKPRLRDSIDRYCGSFKLLMPDGTRINHDQCWMACAIHERKPFTGRDIVVERPDGSRRKVTAHASPMYDDKNDITGAVNLLVDNTELKEANERLSKSEKLLREADTTKDCFLATLAHEVRNSLVPLRSGLELMELPNVPSEAIKESRELMQRHLHHIVRLIDDLNDLSQISLGKVELVEDQIDIAAAIHAAIELARPYMMSRDQKFQHCVPTRPVFVLGDLTRLTQVFTNLMVNASKFTPDQGTVALTCFERGNDVVVSVHDNGIGIRTEDLDKIFDMFSQPGRGLNWKHGGIGIGLSLAKKLVEMHNGKISVRSKGSNLGSEFVVTLPVERRAITADTKNAQCIAPPPMRILVVDDDLSVAKSSAILLKTLGHDVLICDEGRKALSIAAQFRPGLFNSNIIV